MPIPLCRHIKSNKIICRSPALRGEAKCFFHQPRVAALNKHPERRDYPAFALQGLTPAEFQLLLSSGGRPELLHALSAILTAVAAD